MIIVDEVATSRSNSTLKGASYVLKDNGIATLPSVRTGKQQQSDD